LPGAADQRVVDELVEPVQRVNLARVSNAGGNWLSGMDRPADSEKPGGVLNRLSDREVLEQPPPA
jgi:hypothetical protein